MISVSEAKNIIRQQIHSLTPISTDLIDALGLLLAHDIIAPINLPPFDQSAMDGYAFNYSQWDKKSPLEVIGEVAAGNVFEQQLLPNHAARIFTGAAMPLQADTVVMQEKITRNQNQITIVDEQLKQGTNVRLKGSQIANQALALASGTMITPGAVSFIASMGITRVDVIPAPIVAIIVTGNELTKPGDPLLHGNIYESNSYCLAAALKELGIRYTITYCGDHELEISETIRSVNTQHDLILLTGGISVGDYDFVLPALQNNHAEILFHKIKQKPGKPLCMAKLGEHIAFALPGNPASVLTCFYEYVVPAIQYMMGNNTVNQKPLLLPIQGDYVKKSGLTHFLKGKLTKDGVMPLIGQESYRMDSFSVADCLIQLQEEQTEIHRGELVEVHPFNPQFNL